MRKKSQFTWINKKQGKRPAFSELKMVVWDSIHVMYQLNPTMHLFMVMS